MDGLLPQKEGKRGGKLALKGGKHAGRHQQGFTQAQDLHALHRIAQKQPPGEGVHLPSQDAAGHCRPEGQGRQRDPLVLSAVPHLVGLQVPPGQVLTETVSPLFNTASIYFFIKERGDHPPCRVDMKLTLSLCSNLVSSFSLSSQSASLTSTRMPGRLR